MSIYIFMYSGVIISRTFYKLFLKFNDQYSSWAGIMGLF